MPDERTVSSQRIYQGRIVSLRVDEVVLPDGRRSQREIVEARGAVGIIALDAEGNVLLERQFRKPAEQVLWEIPAGTLEPGESPLECARRELVEETGYRAERFTPLVTFYTSPGFCDEQLHLFVARGLRPATQHLETDEFLTVSKVPLRHAVQMVRTGEIIDAKTIAGVLLVAHA